jgi:hypothetical protein
LKPKSRRFPAPATARGDDGDFNPSFENLEIEVTLSLGHQTTPDGATTLLGEWTEGHRRGADSFGCRDEFLIEEFRCFVAVLTPPPLALFELCLCCLG